jgi:hypothetical protein
MANKYYIGKRYHIDDENYVEQYWAGDGFAIYEASAKIYTSINMASDIANMLDSISTIQDERLVKYVIYAVNDDSMISCKEVNDD